MPPLGSVKSRKIKKTAGPLIYMLTFPNDKRYIGQTSRTFEERMLGHKCSATSKKGCRIVANAIKEHGWENITKEILVLCNSNDLDMYETKFIEMFGTMFPNGYNTHPGGHANKKLSVRTRKIMSVVAKKRDVSKYRKSEESKDFPRYLHKVDTRYMRGYRITKHPRCTCKHFCDKDKTWEENFKDAVAFLEKLNKNEEQVVHLPRPLPIGIQSSGNGFRVYWKPENVRHIKNFNTGHYSREQQFERAKTHLISLQKQYIYRDIKILKEKIESLTISLIHQKENMDTLEREIENLRTMFND